MSIFGDTLSGAGQGAIAGTMVAPGIGTAVGTGMGAITGLYRGIQRKKASSMLPEDQDPMQTGLLNELDRRIATARTGANVAAEMAELGASEASGLRALSRGGAGSNGSYGLMLRMIGDRRNKLLATGLEQEAQLLGMKGNLISEMEKRKKFLDLLRSQTQAAQGEQTAQDLGMAGNAMMTQLFKKQIPGVQEVPGVAVGPENMSMTDIETAANAPVLGFGGMPLKLG